MSPKDLAPYASDIALLLGCGCIVVGLALWSPMAAWLFAGTALIAGALLVALPEPEQEPEQEPEASL